MAFLPQVFLGLALASAAGLRAFLPLLVMAVSAHFGWIPLNEKFQWMKSDAMLVTLTVAAVAEIFADKIPVVDHLLDLLSTIIRPLAGTLALASTQAHLDPGTAAVMGLILGAPLAASLHVAKGGTRLASTALTAGFGNPVLSVIEDIASLGISLLAVFLPLAGLLVAWLLLATAWRVRVKLQKKKSAA